MMDFYRQQYGPQSNYSIAGNHDCANAALGGLAGSGALNQRTLMNLFNPRAGLLPFLPSTVWWAAMMQPGSSLLNLNQGSTVPLSFGSFNR